MTRTTTVMRLTTPKRPPKSEEQTTPPSHLFNERLHSMLQWRRPHGTRTELKWAEILLQGYDAKAIEDLAYVVQVGGGASRTLFSSHVDTVHRKGGKQRVLYDPADECYYKADGEPLGADDAAGVWLMLEMIDAKVPGTYVFHRGEECGGIGSRGLAERYPTFLSQFDRAIAFDRRGTYDIITHQGFERTASDAFAEALAEQLNGLGMMYAPSDGGVFTDTANYTDDIAECTNISVGYDLEHTGSESLHLPHLFALRAALLQVDWEALPTEREPGEYEPLSGYDWPSGFPRYGASRQEHKPALWMLDYDEMLDHCYTDPEGFVRQVWTELLDNRPAWREEDDYN